ncbi:hypothetical protein Tco_1266086 [Tanacetum coccineum]
MPVELGSFDAIIGMDWLVRVPSNLCVCRKTRFVILGEVKSLDCSGDECKTGHGRLELSEATKRTIPDKGFIRPSSYPGAAGIVCQGRKSVHSGSSRDPSECLLEERPKVMLSSHTDGFEKKSFQKRFQEPVSAIMISIMQFGLTNDTAVFMDLRSFPSCHVIDSEGIHVDPAKIKSIKDWASPKSPTEIRQFLGLGWCTQSLALTMKEAKYLSLKCDCFKEGFGRCVNAKRESSVRSQDLEALPTLVWSARAYDCEIRYHPGKANVVADALSRKERDQPLRVRALVMTWLDFLTYLDMLRLKHENQEHQERRCWRNVG